MPAAAPVAAPPSHMPEPTPFPDSLCHRCAQLRLIRSGKGSTFLMCQAPELPKYTAQPVRACRGFVAVVR